MNRRKTVNEKLQFEINHKRGTVYRSSVLTWEEIITTKDILPTDHYINFQWKTEPSVSFGNSSEDEPEDRNFIVVNVVRPRPETDDEFLERQREDSSCSKVLEEKERLEYLRLKAKYEKDA